MRQQRRGRRRSPWARGALGVLFLAGCAACASRETRSPTSIGGASESGRLVLRGDEALERGDYPAADASYRDALDATALDPDSSNRTVALVQLAELERLRGRPGIGRAWLADAGAHASDETPLAWSRFLLVRGRYELERDPPQAEATLVAHFEYCIEYELPDRALNSARELALSGTLAHRVTWAERGIALAEELDDPRWLAVLWSNLGWAYDEAAEHAHAREAFREAHDYHERVGRPTQRVVAAWALGRSCRLLGEVEPAEAWLNSSLSQAQSLHGETPSAENAQWLGLALWELAELAVDTGRPSEALARLRDAHRTLRDADIETWWPEGNQRLERRLAELASSRLE